MTIKIDTEQFLLDSLNRILKQVHLNNYKVGMFSPNDVPANIRKLGKGTIPADFFVGARSKIIALKAIDPEEVTGEDETKVTGFFKTTFFLNDDSPFTSNDVYQIKEIAGGKKMDDNEDTGATVKNVYFFVKIELTK